MRVTTEENPEGGAATAPSGAANDTEVRSLAGLVLRAAEQGEIEALLASIADTSDRRFVSELADLASGSYDLSPTSGELLIEEEFEQRAELTDVQEAALVQGIARTKDEGARRIWERALTMLERERSADV